MSALACRVRLLTVFTAFTAYPTGVLVSMKEAPFAAGLDAPDIREGCMAFPHQGVPLFGFHGFHLDSLPAKILEDALHVAPFLFGDGG